MIYIGACFFIGTKISSTEEINDLKDITENVLIEYEKGSLRCHMDYS